MYPFYFYMNFLQGFTRMMNNSNYTLFYVFVHYVLHRLKKLSGTKLHWRTVPDGILKSMGRSYDKENVYVDYDSCLMANVEYLKGSKPVWCYVCCTASLKKYKVLVVPFKDAKSNTVFVSETTRCNLENALDCADLWDNSFLLQVKDDAVPFAEQATISMISSPNECSNDLTDVLLENYFSEPRFLRKNDIFSVDVKDYVPEQLYSSVSSATSVIHFKVKAVKVDGDGKDGCYVAHGVTTVVQEPNVQSYLPRKYCEEVGQGLGESYPPNLIESLNHLERCISPFVKRGVRLHVKPIFLVKGSQGSGKRELVQIASEKLGLHLLNVDFSEVQALTSAQTEAKLRIVLQNAKQTMPCILCLNNIELLGKNAEGQKDERIIATFSREIDTLYETSPRYPIIVIATTSEPELPAELNRIFIETIHMATLDQATRTSLISWLLAKRCLNHEVNLSKIAGMCSDFRFSDLTTLILHAVKHHCKNTAENLKQLKLTQQDFDKAYEYMQSIYTDCKGAPRVPKVHWEDIGGLADLKQEIIRRIQLPMLNAFGFGQSGLLLYGPPGTGKTLLAKAVATEYQLHFLSIKGPEVLNMYVGQSEKNVRQVFERARAAAPCIIFFDELDSLAPNRGRSGDSGGVMDRVVSQLLAEMDGLEGSSSIFIIGATNRPDLVDPALLRPGRFDKMLYVGIHSDRPSQLSVLKALTRKFKLRENGDELEKLLDQLPDHTTGADLYAVCSNAWLNAARKVLSEADPNAAIDQSSVSVELEDFAEAARKLVPSVSREEAERYRKMQTELSSVS